MGTFSTTCRVAVVAAVIVGLGWESALRGEEYYQIRSAGIEILRPEGFQPADGADGIMDPNTGASVGVLVLPTPAADMASQMTADRLKAEGMELVNKSSVTIAGKQGVLMDVRQTAQGIEAGKWWAIFGDRSTTMIVATYLMELEEEQSALLKSVVLGARPIDRKTSPPGSNVGFRVTAGEKLQLASDANKALVYTKGGAIPLKSPTDPMFVVAKSAARQNFGDKQRFALKRLAATAEMIIGRRRSHDPITVDSLQGYETVATAQDEKTREPFVIYQLILFEPGGSYYLMQGLVGEDGEKEFLPEFRSMGRSFQRVEPERPARVARSRKRPARSAGDATSPGKTDEPAHEGQGDSLRRPSLARMSDVVRFGKDGEQAADDRPSFEHREIFEAEADTETVSGRRAARRLRSAKQALPVLEYDDGAVQTTSDFGRRGGHVETFDERAPAGGILVGLRAVRGEHLGGSVQGVEPIFQVGKRYRSPGLQGFAGDDVHLLLAPAGHAVGGMQVRSGGVIDAVRLIYMPLEEGRLDPQQPKFSEWIGGTGGRPRQLITDGSLVVGLGGAFSDEDMKAIRLHYVVPDQVKTAGAEPAAEVRTWTSAGGSYTVEARLESFDGAVAVLVKTTGETIRVPVEKLSDADRQYLSQNGGERDK